MKYLGKAYPFIIGDQVDKMIVLQTSAGAKKIALGTARMRFMFLFVLFMEQLILLPYKTTSVLSAFPQAP